MIRRGDVYWADLDPAHGSRPAKRRPVLIIQSNQYNESQIATVIAAALTSNTSLAMMPSNTFLPASATGLPRDSVVNMTALVTLNKSDLSGRAGTLPFTLLSEVDLGLHQVLGI